MKYTKYLLLIYVPANLLNTATLAFSSKTKTFPFKCLTWLPWQLKTTKSCNAYTIDLMGAGSLSAWIHFFHCETPECTYNLLNNNVFIMSVTSL